ncbi:MAG TPA: hypothetical protein VMG62_03090, partial [Solirubrobacteraceae bacterium]|nr:hypothetical protein [Solirubrobacteraceae bacterium]
ETKIGAVVISGDFITKAEANPCLHEVPEQITKLMDGLGLQKRQHLLVVPGNHDIDLVHGDKSLRAAPGRRTVSTPRDEGRLGGGRLSGSLTVVLDMSGDTVEL